MRWISNLFLLSIHLTDALHVRVDGEGYLRFLQNGSLIYQKEAELQIRKGVITNKKGDILSPQIHVKDTDRFSIDLNGTVWASLKSKSIGQLVIANCKGKKKTLLPGVFKFEGPVKLGNPGEDHWGVIRSLTFKSDSSPLETTTNSLSSDLILDFKSDVEVEEDQFTVGNLVKNEVPSYLKSIVLGETPSFGTVRQLTRYQVESRMKIAGHNLQDFKSNFPAQMRVKRKAQSILHEQICEVALEAAKKQLGEVELAPGYQPTINAPLGELNLAVESLKGYKNSWTAIVGIYVDGKRFNGRSIQILCSGIRASLKAGSTVSVVLRSHGVLVETKGKLKMLKDNDAQVEVKPNVIVEGILQKDGSIEVNL